MPRLPRRARYSPALAALVCLCLQLAQSAIAADAKPATRWGAEVGVGVEYDSNVSVEEVDTATNEGDYALTVDAGVEMQHDFNDTTELGLTYDFSQSAYDKFSQVDRQTHILGADLGLDFKSVDPALSVFYIVSRLDGGKFLDLYRASPSISGFLAKKWFARGAYAYSDKTIHEREGRDAKTNSGEGDLYYFRRGLRSYFNLGYRYRNENARSDRYDYISNSIKLRYIHRFEIFSRLSKLELAWRFENRQYGSDESNFGTKRDDDRNRWRIDYEIPLVEQAAIQFFWGYANYQSNYAPADYDQNLVGTRFIYSW